MKTFLSIAFILCFSHFHSQAKSVDIVEFFNWNADDGIHYDFIFISEKITEYDVKKPVTIRVKYSLDGGVSTKLVEYYATIYWSEDEDHADNLIGYIEAHETAKILEGKNGYTPDNFVLYYDKSGKFTQALQADHNQMAEKNVKFAKVFKTNYETVNDLRSLIRLYYKNTDPLYRDLMTYAAKYD